MFFHRIQVGDGQRAVITRNGRFLRIVGPGEYSFFTWPGTTINTEIFSLQDPVFTGAQADSLVRDHPAAVAEHLIVIATDDLQVAVVTLDGNIARVIGPGKRVLYWRGGPQIAFTLIDTLAFPEVPPRMLAPLERLGREPLATFVSVEESRVGLLYLENRFTRLLEPGKYGFWSTAGSPRVELVDLRRQSIEISGQEILTKDKVSLRVNILAEYRVTDAVRAKQAVKDFAELLYRTLQLAVRQTLGRKTLEELLADKTEVDRSAEEEVRAAMETVGVQVGSIALKDIILPGDMREILNQVVAAEKQAQANLIRRREETAATRSLLNTARLMEDNPILVRLKELETLEKLVEKVDRITVNNGFDGLLHGLIEKRTDSAGI